MAPVRAPRQPEESPMSHPMPHIVLSEEQARLVATAYEPVEVRDPKGNVIGRLEPKNLAEIVAECKRRLASNEPRYSSEHTQALLQALEKEWERTGGFDQEYMREFVRRFQADGP